MRPLAAVSKRPAKRPLYPNCCLRFRPVVLAAGIGDLDGPAAMPRSKATFRRLCPPNQCTILVAPRRLVVSACGVKQMSAGDIGNDAHSWELGAVNRSSLPSGGVNATLREPAGKRGQGTDLFFVIFPRPALLPVLNTPPNCRLDLIDEALATG